MLCDLRQTKVAALGAQGGVDRGHRASQRLPTLDVVTMNAMLVQYASNRMVNHFIQIGRLLIKSGHRWENDAPRLGNGQHITQMYS